MARLLAFAPIVESRIDFLDCSIPCLQLALDFAPLFNLAIGTSKETKLEKLLITLCFFCLEAAFQLRAVNLQVISLEKRYFVHYNRCLYAATVSIPGLHSTLNNPRFVLQRASLKNNGGFGFLRKTTWRHERGKGIWVTLYKHKSVKRSCLAQRTADASSNHCVFTLKILYFFP